MPFPKTTSRILPILTALMLLLFSISGCRGNDDPLIVYSGKGLKLPMDEIAAAYEEQTGTPVEIIYAGSNTLLSTIKKTQSGDIFVPGSQAYITNAGELITSHEFVGHHTPTIAVSQKMASKILEIEDLSKPGTKIATGNADMAAIGRITDAILKKMPPEESFQGNIVVKASTVNELIQLVIDGEVDAALIWRDMLSWDGADNLTELTIPAEYNAIKEIRAGILSTTASPKQAKKFLEFMQADGRRVFAQHGFTRD